MTDNRWDTLYALAFTSGTDEELEALASLKADCEALEKKWGEAVDGLTHANDREALLRAELERSQEQYRLLLEAYSSEAAKLERIEGELAQSIAEHALTLKHLKGIEGERDRLKIALERVEGIAVELATGSVDNAWPRSSVIIETARQALGHTTEGAPK